MPMLFQTGLRYLKFFECLHAEHHYQICFVETPRKCCVISVLIYCRKAFCKVGDKYLYCRYADNLYEQSGPFH